MSSATARVLCHDGKMRIFRADIDGEYLSYQGTKYVYLLWDEPDGRGIITMTVLEGNYVLAPQRMQPKRISADTWAGSWFWTGAIHAGKNDG